MATPLSASRFVSALKAEGLTVREYRNWRSHNRNHKGAWGPINGVMIHHTVTSGTSNSVALCYNGHSTLPGPLCHSVGAKDGTVWMVGNGRANHAGSGDDDVMRDVIAERNLSPDNEANTDGNARFYGLEIVNLGNGRDEYPRKQYDAAVRWASAICRAYGWSARSVIGHKEWQPGKIDPRGPVEGGGDFDMDTFRRDVQRRLDGKAGSAPSNDSNEEDPLSGYSKKDICDAVWDEDAVCVPAEWGAPGNDTWKASSIIVHLGKLLYALDTKVDELDAKVDALEFGGVDEDALAAKVADLLAARLAE